MTFEQFYRVLQKRWAIVVICFLFVGLGAYIGSSKLIKPSYSSSVLVEVIVRAGGTALSNDNILASQQLAQTESNLAITRTVLGVVASHHPGLSFDNLLKKVTSTVKPNTQLFAITVQDPDPAMAAGLANEIADTLIQQQLEVTQQPPTEGSFLVVAEKAQPAIVPTSPNKLINTAAGLLVGLLLGMLLAVLFERLDTRIRTKEGIASLLNWPVLGTIWQTHSNDAIISTTGYSINADAYGILRNSLESVSSDKSLYTLVITSAMPEDGKSVIAANLAISMAKSGKSTLLIDANLRHPTLYELFDIPAHAMGFSNALLALKMSASANYRSKMGNDLANTEERSLTPFIRAVNIPNLSIMSSGPLPPSPSELLGPKAMQRFFVMLTNSGVEAVIFDTPSLLGLSDAVFLASKVDGTLVVVDITRTKREDLKQAKEVLEQAGANVLGCVVNKEHNDHKNAPYKHIFYSYDPGVGRRGSKDENYNKSKNLSVSSSPAPLTSVPAVPERRIPATPAFTASVTSVPTQPVLSKPVTSSTPKPVIASTKSSVDSVPSRPVVSSTQRQSASEVTSKQRESSSHLNQGDQNDKVKQRTSDVDAAKSSRETTRNEDGEQTMLLPRVQQKKAGE
jgi:capsular exopolysaccharide synthesis family protein